MSIKQINLSYLIQEDRILFRVNTNSNDEFLFLLTRRIALFLLAAISHLFKTQVDGHHSIESESANKGNLDQIDSMQGTDQQNEFIVGSSFPLGNSPMLVLDVNCSISGPSGELQIAIDLIYGENLSVNLQLPIPIVLAFFKLLEKISDQASWGRAVLSNPSNDTIKNYTMNATSGSSTIH